MPRKPIAAGMFYEDTFSLLDRQIKECFAHRQGPGALPVRKRDKEITGIIVPHAGYQFSGPCAAWAYKEIAESGFPDIYVILGANHQAIGKSATLLDDFETPFGTVKTDIEFAKKLIKNSNFNLIENPELHLKEHSIEVQIPFLQFVNKEYLDDLRIVPVIASRESDYKAIAKAIHQTANILNKKICLIASSDFTHYGYSYGYVPFHENIKEKLYELDKGAIKLIEKLDSWAFLSYIDETKATICGPSAITTLIETAKLMKAKQAELLHYYTSGDITGDYGNAVGYASMVFR